MLEAGGEGWVWCQIILLFDKWLITSFSLLARPSPIMHLPDGLSVELKHYHCLTILSCQRCKPICFTSNERMTADSLTFYSFHPHLISWNVLYIGLYDRTTPIIIRLKAVQCRVTQSVRPQTAPVSPADFWQLSQLSCFLPGSVREREEGAADWLTGLHSCSNSADTVSVFCQGGSSCLGLWVILISPPSPPTLSTSHHHNLPSTSTYNVTEHCAGFPTKQSISESANTTPTHLQHHC